MLLALLKPGYGQLRLHEQPCRPLIIVVYKIVLRCFPVAPRLPGTAFPDVCSELMGTCQTLLDQSNGAYP